MPIKQLEYPRFQAIDGNGNPLAGGKVYTYVAGTVSTALTTWTDSAKTSANTNPVILDADGEANIWFDAPIKIKLDDANDVQQWTIDNIPPNASPTASGVYNLIQNGSFEVSDTEATNWTLAASTNGTIAVDTTDQVHGSNSLKFTGTDSGGGGTATSAKFAVQPTNGYMVGFVYKSNSATSLNSVQIKWYNAAGAALSTDTLYSEGASTPTTYTTYRRLAYAPANAIEAEIIINGVASGGTTTTATSNFDNIILSEQCAIDQTGVTSPVNYIKATNSATGSPVILIPAGTDTNINLQIDGKGSGFVDLVTWGVNGTQVQATATQIDYNVVATLGTVEASKTVTADASGFILFDTSTASKRIAFNNGTYHTLVLGSNVGDIGFYDITNARWAQYYTPSANRTTFLSSITASGGVTGNVIGNVSQSSGNLTLNSNGANATRINYTAGTGGVVFGNGASGTNANVSAAGVFTGTGFVGDVKATNGTTVLDSGTDGTDATFTGSVNSLKTAVINIGDWNMDSTASVVISHGITLSNIRAVSALIRNDTDSAYTDLHYDNSAGTINQGIGIASGSMTLYRSTSGVFDNTDYDSTSYNRGWVTITYIA